MNESDLRSLEAYIHNRMHELASHLQTIMNYLAVLQIRLDRIEASLRKLEENQ